MWQEISGAWTSCWRPKAYKWGRIAFPALALLLTGARVGVAENPPSMGSESSSAILLRVSDYAKVSPPTLRRALQEATRIFAKAGVDALWIECPASRAKTDPPPACSEPPGPATAVLRVLPGPPPGKQVFRDTAFGFADGPALASVYFDRVQYLAEAVDRAPFETEVILGVVIAHEIGHLLLGSNSHSDTGIMRARWDRKAVQSALMGRQLFTPEQAGVMRENLRARRAATAIGGVASRASRR